MNELLLFIVEYLDFIYNEHNFKFIDSETTEGNAYLCLANEDLKVIFTRERLQISINFVSAYRNEKEIENWYSIDIVRMFLENVENIFPGILEDKYRLDHIIYHENIYFIKKYFLQILKCFKKENLESTLRRFQELKKIRSKRLFGD